LPSRLPAFTGWRAGDWHVYRRVGQQEGRADGCRDLVVGPTASSNSPAQHTGAIQTHQAGCNPSSDRISQQNVGCAGSGSLRDTASDAWCRARRHVYASCGIVMRHAVLLLAGHSMLAELHKTPHRSLRAKYPEKQIRHLGLVHTSNAYRLAWGASAKLQGWCRVIV